MQKKIFFIVAGGGYDTDRHYRDTIQTKHPVSEFKLEFLYENDNYRLVGLPFYNETMKKREFKEAFNRAVKTGDKIKK
jgi:hypothetical protein